MKSIAVVGSGFSGAVVARELANKGYAITVIESRNHIGGNCHTYRDPDTDILVHAYGPHIFHTNNIEIWNYVNQYGVFIPYVNKVKAIVKNQVYTLPVNLLTINQFFGKTFSPKEAEIFINSLADKSIGEPVSFEEQALRFVGKELYEAFFKGYTKKQWGLDPRDLPASILKRLPLRFNYDDNYYNHQFQGIPKDGYTALISNLLDSKNIEIHLNRHFERIEKNEFDHVFYSGPIDYWFDFAFGRLAYRTLDFETIREEGDFQGTAVMNYCDEHIPFTRITEHKHFSPWEQHGKTICFREYSRLCEDRDIPYYPVRLIEDKEHLASYLQLVKEEKNVTFMGRLGTYRYLDMDVTIAEALDLVKSFLNVYHK